MRKTILSLIGAGLLWPIGLIAQSSIPGELLVQFRASASAADKTRALGRANAEMRDDILPGNRRHDGRGDLVLVRHQPDLPPAAAKRNLEADPAVEFAEPNWIYTHQGIVDDPYFLDGKLWGMYGSSTSPANPYGSNAAGAWAAGKTGMGSAKVYVGVIDEGIQYTHPDLSGQVGNPKEFNNGVDDDGNGFVDDIYGWDFDANDSTVYDGRTKGNLDDHGTHVAGTIGAKAGNGTGVAGVIWNIGLISAKFLGRNGGTTANAIKALDYLTDLKAVRGVNIVATNNSWGGGGFSQALYDAIQRSGNAGILFIAAAGNGNSRGIGLNNDTTPHYPSSYDLPTIIAVGALTSSGARATFSNYGATSVDIFAPGSGIYSTTAYNTYSSYSGTSMATPHVTGAVALYAAVKGLNPASSAEALRIKDAIIQSAQPTTSAAGRCMSNGRLDVGAALLK
jgi:subtilisin family serine protease